LVGHAVEVHVLVGWLVDGGNFLTHPFQIFEQTEQFPFEEIVFGGLIHGNNSLAGIFTAEPYDRIIPIL
jgi:hypothetical protein